jgi:mannan endo-1,4-beta-mannosidase
MASPFKRMNNKQKFVTAFSAAGLIAVGSIIWATPEVQRAVSGPTAAEVALQREQARASDLKTQLTAAESENQQTASQLSKQLADSTARANDLATQLADANKKLGEGDPNAGAVGDAKVAEAKAGSLKSQLDKAKADAAAKKAAAEKASAVEKGRLAGEAAAATARADDLKTQIDKLQAVPVATASLDKAGIINMRKTFGMYTAQSPFSYAEFDQNEAAFARDAQVSGYFGDWSQNFRADAVQSAWLRGQVPLLTWESTDKVGKVGELQPDFSNAQIISGRYDDYIRQYATDIKATGLPLILRFDQEMQLINAYPWADDYNGNEQGSYVAMWQHVHDIFQQVGANDLVVWMWAPNRINQIPDRPKPKAFYPGDAYVDLVAVDAYWRVTDLDQAPTFDNTFGPTLPYLRELGKPLWIAETGATDTGGKKIEWTEDFFDALQRPENQDIRGFMLFALTVTSNQGTNNWSWTSTGAAVQAAREGLAESGFGVARP